jgi:cell division septation protein DedD
MEETANWKGHSFTLLIFGGIVVLCSIFFILGMLVGRDQGQRLAQLNVVEETAAKLPENSSALPRFEAIVPEEPEGEEELALQPPPAPLPEPAVAESVAESVPAIAPVPAPAPKKEYLQIAALRDQKGANRLLETLKSEKFQATIVPPDPSEPAGSYRVLVGPYDSIPEAELAMEELKSKGYKDVIRKK